MNRNKIIMLGFGALALVSAGVFGYLIYDSKAAYAEKDEELSTSVDSANRIIRGKISPTAESVEAIRANTSKLTVWREEAIEMAGRGDEKKVTDVVADRLKSEMISEANELRKLPGGVEGRLVREGFGFGFDEYIVGGRMPSADERDSFTRIWPEVCQFVRIMADSGVVELSGVAFTLVKKPSAEEVAAAERNARRSARGKQKEKVRENPITAQHYTLTFLARPPAFAKVLNALRASDRFIVVDSFDLRRETDALREVISARESSKSSQGKNRRRSRYNQVQADDADEGENLDKKGLVTDPMMEPPMTVKLEVTTYDFGTKNVEVAKVGEKEAEQ